MSNVFDFAVELAREGIEEMPAEEVEEVVQRGTDLLEIMAPCLCAVPAPSDSPVGEFVEAALHVSCHWDMASTAEKITVIAFLDIVSEMVISGEMEPQAVYGPDDFLS